MVTAGSVLALHPDPLLPAESGEQDIAGWMYAETRDLPVIWPHGHVDARLLLDDEPLCPIRPRC